MRFDIKEDGKRILMVCVASLIMALNIKTFVRTGGLYPGGATGLTILIQRVADLFFGITIPYTLVNVILNAIPVYIGFRFIGKKFTLYSCLMILLTGILTDLIPGYPITYDTLLISVFGGLINGAMISLCLFANATSGGTDFIAIYLSEKKGMDSWNLVLGLNVLILGAAGLLFGWDEALWQGGGQPGVHLSGCLLPPGALCRVLAGIPEPRRGKGTLPARRSGRREGEKVPEQRHACPLYTSPCRRCRAGAGRRRSGAARSPARSGYRRKRR